METLLDLKSCPFCGGKVNIIICDDEGNHHSEDYEYDPWSGLGFLLEHNEADNPNCPIAHEEYGHCGRIIYDSRKDAIEAWNTRIVADKNLC